MNYLHQNDLPSSVKFKGNLAIDTETRGLNIFQRDRLCVVQISDGQGDAHLVQFKKAEFDKAKNLKKFLSDDSRQKIFHFARFDIAAIKIYLGVEMQNFFCTKIASKLVRTFTDKHGLKDLVKDLLEVDLSKQAQCSDWSGDLTGKQIDYAASDVLYLHAMCEKLIIMLKEEGRLEIAKKCFDFLPHRVDLDIMGWQDHDIFSHEAQ